MAYLFLRNVRNVLPHLTCNSLSPHLSRQSIRLTSLARNTNGISKRVIKRNLTASNSVNIVSDEEASGGLGKKVAENQPPVKSPRRFHGIRTKSVHLERFNESLKKGKLIF